MKDHMKSRLDEILDASKENESRRRQDQELQKRAIDEFARKFDAAVKSVIQPAFYDLARYAVSRNMEYKIHIDDSRNGQAESATLHFPMYDEDAIAEPVSDEGPSISFVCDKALKCVRLFEGASANAR